MVLYSYFKKIKSVHVNLLESKHNIEIDETRTLMFYYVDNKLFKTNMGMNPNLFLSD